MDVPVELLERYRRALAEGARLAPASEQHLYALHAEELETLVTLLTTSSMYAVRKHVERELRTFGWFSLSGEHGAHVENAFHALASTLKQRGSG